jgi:parvulin-like peptidyl-prolyl isomerase
VISPSSSRATRLLRGALGLVALGLPACHHDATSTAPAGSASGAAAEVPPGLANRVLAKVGDTTITLGDYQAVLDGMDRFERLRYQTADRRKQLLDEIIDVVLLAHEAERRGLADKPETQELVRQILRDAVLHDLREKQPSARDIPTAEVRAYYDAHHAEFKDPERRRVADIVVGDAPTAARALDLARTATPKQWGEFVQKYSRERGAADLPLELAGDVGMVTPPSFGKNDNVRVPEVVRAAVFEIADLGGVLGRVVSDPSGFYIVRLTGKSDAHERSFEEAERTIRLRLLEEKLRRAESDLEQDLRAKFPVQIDDAALAKVPVPSTSAVPAPSGHP